MRVAINAWFLNQPGTGSGQYLQGLLHGFQQIMPTAAPEHRFLLVAPSQEREIQVPGLHVPGLQAPEFRAEFWPFRSSRWRSNLGKVLFEQVAFPRACRQWEADVAHVPYWGSPLKPPVTTVVTIHDLIPL